MNFSEFFGKFNYQYSTGQIKKPFREGVAGIPMKHKVESSGYAKGTYSGILKGKVRHCILSRNTGIYFDVFTSQAAKAELGTRKMSVMHKTPVIKDEEEGCLAHRTLRKSSLYDSSMFTFL